MQAIQHVLLRCYAGISVALLLLLLLLFPNVSAGQLEEQKLAAPADWAGETISLPPGFAKDMKLTGKEYIRFAPGMMRPESDSFFSYAFVFEVRRNPALTEQVVKEEFLKYYRGLCKAVLRDNASEVDPNTFTFTLKTAAADLKKLSSDDSAADSTVRYDGVLKWVEPFQTKKAQTLYLDIHTWTAGDRSYLFALVSPRMKSDEIWTQLKQIRTDYRKKQGHGQ